MSHLKTEHPKIGLALSGGSALGLAHVGVIKCLLAYDIPIDCVAGTSAGAVAAVGVAFDVPLAKMVEISKKLNWSTISEFGYSKMGVNTNEPLGEIITEMVGKARIEDSLKPLAIVATNIDTGEEVIFYHGDLVEAVRASTSIPGIFVPVKARRRKLVDGGLVENLPMTPLKTMGAKIRIGVDLGRWRTFKKTRNLFDVITNTYGILTKSPTDFVQDKSDIIIEPHLEKFNTSDFEKSRELMAEGYRAAKIMIPKIKKLISESVAEKKGFIQRIIDFFKKR